MPCPVSWKKPYSSHAERTADTTASRDVGEGGGDKIGDMSISGIDILGSIEPMLKSKNCSVAGYYSTGKAGDVRKEDQFSKTSGNRSTLYQDAATKVCMAEIRTVFMAG